MFAQRTTRIDLAKTGVVIKRKLIHSLAQTYCAAEGFPGTQPKPTADIFVQQGSSWAKRVPLAHAGPRHVSTSSIQPMARQKSGCQRMLHAKGRYKI
jgi:hypothetical protein